MDLVAYTAQENWPTFVQTNWPLDSHKNRFGFIIRVGKNRTLDYKTIDWPIEVRITIQIAQTAGDSNPNTYKNHPLERKNYPLDIKTSFQSCLQGLSLLMVGWRKIIFLAIFSPVSSESNPQQISYPSLINDFNQAGFGVAPDVDTAIQFG